MPVTTTSVPNQTTPSVPNQTTPSGEIVDRDATGGYKSLSWDWARDPRDPGVMFLLGETMQHEGAVDGQFSALQPVPLIDVLTGDAWIAGGATGGYRS